MPLDLRKAPIAVTMLRRALGVMFIAHSLYLKLFIFTLPGTAQFFASIGLPGPLAYLVFIAEAVGGVLLLYLMLLAFCQFLLGDGLWAHSPSKNFASNPAKA